MAREPVIITLRRDELTDVLARIDRLTFRLACRKLDASLITSGRRRGVLYALDRVRDVDLVLSLPCVLGLPVLADTCRSPTLARLLGWSPCYAALAVRRHESAAVVLAVIQRAVVLAELADEAAAAPIRRDRRRPCLRLEPDPGDIKLWVGPSRHHPLLDALRLAEMPASGEIDARHLGAIAQDIRACERALDDADAEIRAWWGAWQVGGLAQLVAGFVTTAAIGFVMQQLHKHRLPLVVVYAAAVSTYLALVRSTSLLADRAAAPLRTRRDLEQVIQAALVLSLALDLCAL